MGWPAEQSAIKGEGREQERLLSPSPSPPITHFDRILVTAGAPEVPQPLLAQLADGGVLVAPRGKPDSERLVSIMRCGGAYSERAHIPVRFVPLIGAYGWRSE
jgi:protein-L-isoaspartate(D-aspartate) O-methyltransferase